MMKNLFLAFSCAAMITGLSSPPASASEVNDYLTGLTVTSAGPNQYNFSFTGTSDSGSGVFTTTTTGTAGQFLITGISGTTDGSAITSLFAVNTFPIDFGGADNLLYFPQVVTSGNTNPGFLDLAGVSYALADGMDVNLYYGIFGAGDPEVYNVLYSLPTPEPTSLVLLGTGALGLLGIIRRRYVTT